MKKYYYDRLNTMYSLHFNQDTFAAKDSKFLRRRTAVSYVK